MKFLKLKELHWLIFKYEEQNTPLKAANRKDKIYGVLTAEEYDGWECSPAYATSA